MTSRTSRAFGNPQQNFFIRTEEFVQMAKDVPRLTSLFRLLQDCLMNCHNFGAPINELTLKNCYGLPEDTVALLKDNVPNIRIVDDPQEEHDTQVLSDSDTEETDGEEDW
jgi:hypothetical protein